MVGLVSGLLERGTVVSRAALATPLLLVEVAAIVAVLLLLGPLLFIRRKYPFDRLMALLELVLIRARSKGDGPTGTS